MRLAIVSDLHCHPSDVHPRDSYLIAGALRRQAGKHPVEALLRLIEKEPRAGNAEVLIVPGDLTNRVSQVGLAQGWEHILEIGSAVHARATISALGNHDVDSRKQFHKDPVHIAKFLRAGFPFPDQEACDSFFSQGFCVVSIDPESQFIVVNSVVDHHDEATAKRGAFGSERVDALHSALGRLPKARIRVAIMHHHPIQHSDALFSDEDVIETGDALLDVLRSNGCGLVIHGHKHVPRLRYADKKSGRIAVLACGSFSAILREFGSFTRNLFHIVELRTDPDSLLCGEVYSWEWQLGTGWVPATVRSSSFPFRTGFGSAKSQGDVAEEIIKLAAAADLLHAPTVEESRLLQVVPELRYLTPAEFGQLQPSLEHAALELWCDEIHGYELGKLYSAG